jgi:hypothetical protein
LQLQASFFYSGVARRNMNNYIVFTGRKIWENSEKLSPFEIHPKYLLFFNLLE